MARELIISLYLGVFKALFVLLRFFPLKRDKTICVTTFDDNALQVIEHLQGKEQNIIMLKEYDTQSKNPIQFIHSIYHLATAKTIFVDNYFGFLSVTNFKPEVNVIQLWHAAGAVKRFGLQDPSIKHRNKRANKRFQSVYNRFDHVVVGSDKMAHIFIESFGVNESQILRTGVPRTDFFFQKDKIKDIQNQLQNNYPFIKGKKVILYAPTFREKELNEPKIHLDFNHMFEKLRHDYVILLKLHPAIAHNHSVHIPSFVLDVSHYKNINHLLTITDILITDYSSIPVEFSLLHRPMIFYPYDLENYQSERGFWESYKENMPGPVATSTEEIIHYIVQDNFDMEKVRQYSKVWNKYSNGNATSKLINALEMEDKH